MKRIPVKTLVLLAAAAVLLTFAVGGTVAFLTAGPKVVVNTFSPVQVDTKIVENLSVESKSGIAVQNPQNDKSIPAYVRVAVVGNWVDAEGNIVAPWSAPTSPASGWTRGNDGFYYYNSILAVGKTTSDLFSSAITHAGMPEDAHHLMVTVVHQSIQAAGMPSTVDTAQEAFAHAAASVK